MLAITFCPCLLKHSNHQESRSGRLSQNCKYAASCLLWATLGLGRNGLATRRQVFASLCGIQGAVTSSHIILDAVFI